MQFIELRNQLSPYLVFSLNDILKLIPNFNRIQLDRWERKGYLKKIKRGFYCFADIESNQNFLFYTANKIYVPSYVSLSTALRYYGFIPEEIFQITSVGTKKATSFETPIGNFIYRHIKPGLFWGYQLVDFAGHKLLLAEPEKAVLDYLYLNPKLKTVSDFESMRINIDEFRSQVDPERFQQYLKIFNNKQLSRRAKIFLTIIRHDNP